MKTAGGPLAIFKDTPRCSHRHTVKFREPKVTRMCANQAAYGKPLVCEECIKTGSQWLHLRQCLICGHVHCCDSSPNKHATKHAAHTHHQIARSVEPGETWSYCYADRLEPIADNQLPEVAFHESHLPATA